MLQEFLSLGDANRALQALRKLGRHDVRRWALTGGFAVEIHRLRLGRQPSVRILNDLDFIADSFECIPQTLARDFLFRHVHPSEPPGRTMLQFIDADSALRIDVFRTSGATMSRTFLVELAVGSVRVISIEDLVARAARLKLPLAEGVPTPSKHARDFLRLVELVDPALMETAWQDHRKAHHPVTFTRAKNLLQNLIAAHPELLITLDYSHDAEELCQRCAPTSSFSLADPNLVLDLLGYC